MHINLATFNIFWYGSSAVDKNPRTDDDQKRIAQVLTRLDADVFVFQEILDLGGLETLLRGIAGHTYELHRSDDAWLTSADPPSKSKMKIVSAYDANVLELVAAAPLRNPVVDPEYKGRRDPYAMHLRVRATGEEFTLVGVHLKSGLPNAGQGDRDAEIRLRETTFLASWLAGTLDVKLEPFERPPTEDVIVMGDCNATESNFSVAPLLDGRHYQPCQVATSLDPAAPLLLDDPGEQWSTFLDRAVIDHVIVSLMVRPKISSALIYAFDSDPALDEEPAGGGHWLRKTTDYRVEPYENAGVRPVPNLYRISDHRPVQITMETA